MRSFLSLTVLAALFAAAVLAQVAASRLEGHVEDPTGGLVHGAKIEAVNLLTGARFGASANEQGLFVFPSLPPGSYRVTVAASGFRTTIIPDLVLPVSATVNQAVRLELGAVNENITVESKTETVQTTDSQLGRSITIRDIDTLPQVDRWPLFLAIFQPGVQIDPFMDRSSSRVNGTRTNSNNTTLDGVAANEFVVPRLGWVTPMSNTDAVSEFHVVLHSGKAEYGRNAGAQIELITRSGTNAFHGNVFEYLRNTALNASDFFNNMSGVPRPKFIRNIFGGSFGGPVRRDRTFFFANYQGGRTRQDVVRNRTVLTPEAKRGLFRWRPPGSSEILSYDIVRNDPRGKGIDALVAGNLKMLPASNNLDLGDGLNTAGFRFNNPAGEANDGLTVKADHNLTSAHRLFFRYSHSRWDVIDAIINNSDSPFPGGERGTQYQSNPTFSIGSTWNLRPTAVNELRIGRSVSNTDFLRPQRPKGPALVSALYTTPILPTFAQGRFTPAYTFTDNISFVKGRHIWKAGATVHDYSIRFYDDYGIHPDVTFGMNYGNAPPGTVGPTGNISSADRQRFELFWNELLGRMDQVVQSFYGNLKEFSPGGTRRQYTVLNRDFALFFQDDWRVTRRLTLNFGLRWEYFGVQHEKDRIQGAFDKADLANGVSQVADFSLVPGKPWYGKDLNNLAPRVGFSYDPWGNGKTAIRGSWGIFYDHINGGAYYPVDLFTPGIGQVVSVFPNAAPGSDVRAADGIPAPQKPGAPVLKLPATRSTMSVQFDPNFRTGYVQHFSLGIQRELYRNTVLDAGYVGTMGIKLLMDLDGNQRKIYGDFLKSFQELQAYVARGTVPPPGNTLVKLFGSPDAAVAVISPGLLNQGAVGIAAEIVDRGFFSRYTAAGLNDFYLRNYPQFSMLSSRSNEGRSNYHSLQASIRRQTGALKVNANYTFGKIIDTWSTDGNSPPSVIDNFNTRLQRGRGDADRTHSLNYSLIYDLPVGKGHRWARNASRWLDGLVGGWELGLLGFWQSGAVFTVSSTRMTTGADIPSWANYTGDRNIGSVTRLGDGVRCFTQEEAARFSFPAAGEIGTSGRNTFRGPRLFNLDLALVKRFPIREGHTITFRGEFYNLPNNVNFAVPVVDMASPASFGKIAATVGNPRIIQMALRYDF